MKKICLVAFICAFIDQIIKFLLNGSLDVGDSISVINGFFAITVLYNTGAAFSILTSNTILLIVISVLALSLIYFCLIRNRDLSKLETIIYGILIGGIFGNLFDRIVYGHVIDYLDFTIFGFPFPVFNFADICIVVSILLIIILSFKGDKDEISGK